MRAKIRKILEECIENGIVLGYSRAHKHTDDPGKYDIQQKIEDAIWLEIDERFDFERDLCDELVKGFYQLEAKRNECNDHPDAPHGIWYEIDQRFDFDDEPCVKLINGFDQPDAKRNECNDHPDAPHGMDRNASHNAGRYVCECESWEPEKREWVYLTEEEMLHIVTRDGLQLAEAIEAKLKEKNA